MASNRPIFVLGCPRSGTSLLRLMLRAHPRLAIPPETRFLLDAYEHRGAYGDLRDLANRRALAEWIVAGAGTRFGGLGLDPHETAAEIVAGPPTLGSALEITLRAYARRLGKPRWGDKRPGYVQHIDALLRLFPHAQIVHLVRDGRDCVAALKSTPWWRMGTYHAIATWTQAIDAGHAAARRLPSDSYIEVRYERLIADPSHELRHLCAFLDEEYAPAMAEAGARALRSPEPLNGFTDRPSPNVPAARGGVGMLSGPPNPESAALPRRPAGGPAMADAEDGPLPWRPATGHVEDGAVPSRRPNAGFLAPHLESGAAPSGGGLAVSLGRPAAEVAVAGMESGVGELEPWELSLCEAVMGDRMLAYGYELSSASWPPARHLARYAAITAHRRLAARKRAMLDLRLRAAEPQPLASAFR